MYLAYWWIMPTIGVAKKTICGESNRSPAEPGALAPLMDKRRPQLAPGLAQHKAWLGVYRYRPSGQLDSALAMGATLRWLSSAQTSSSWADAVAIGTSGVCALLWQISLIQVNYGPFITRITSLNPINTVDD